MDSMRCHVIYVHRDFRKPRLICAQQPDTPDNHQRYQQHQQHRHDLSDLAPTEPAHLLQPLLDAFGHVNICADSTSCMTTVLQLQDAAMIDLRPTVVLLDTPADDVLFEKSSRSRSLSPHSTGDDEISTPDEEVYGLKLLQRVISEAHLRGLSKLVIPIPAIPIRHLVPAADFSSTSDTASSSRMIDFGMIQKCIELGAVDAMMSPLSTMCILNLQKCIYKAHRDAVREQQMLMQARRGRQRSWVGVNEGKPFAYLREAMVSGLMKHICRSVDADERIYNVQLNVSSERRAAIGAAVGQWSFNAHAFNDDELIVAAMIMFKHALDMPELEHWRIPTDQLIGFLVACRAAYNSFVPYHNFRHVIDVLQATFHFLIRIGAVVPYTDHSEPERQLPEKSPMAALLEPCDALTLLITAIGHDVGHPGVNNGFLIKLNAPLAQLYNDRSVLESFHCAAYSQILRRYWPTAFDDSKMRHLMISSILATDMGLHFDYMKKLENTQQKLVADDSTDGWNGRMLLEQKALACSLLIKCADISNVARKYAVALDWMNILADEFARQASMEADLDIPTSLLAEPKKDTLPLSRAQLNFMNLFAIPLFQGVTDIMPAMQYTVDELERNKSLFEQTIRDEVRLRPPSFALHDSTPSPRTRSIAVDGPDDGDNAGDEEKANQGEGEIGHETSLLSSHDNSGSNGTVRPGENVGENGTTPTRAQRHSETTDGSNSGPYSGEWASRATSATTGQMPLSPSTKNTSIVSRDSLEQQHLAVPTYNGIDYDQQRANSRPVSRSEDEGLMVSAEDEQMPSADDSSHLGSSLSPKGDGRHLLKKKSSRFLSALNPFKRSKGPGSPMPSPDPVI